MPRDVAYLLDILEAAKLAAHYVSAKTKEEFILDTQCQDAVIRRLEIMGEAARRISLETRASLPALPWAAMINMRNLRSTNMTTWISPWFGTPSKTISPP